MRRFAAVRLLFALLAVMAVSTDTAIKLAHGIEHAHERSHSAAGQPRVAGAQQVTSTLTGPDGDGDHEVLHGGPPATTPLQLDALIAAPPLTVRTAAVVVRAASVPAPSALARPPSADRAPARPRAPPVG